MTLLEFIDEHLMSSSIDVYSDLGVKVAHLDQGEEEGLRQIKDYTRGEILREVQTGPGLYAVYVKAKPLAAEHGPIVMGYPGEVPDEAAFSLDWRAREPKASPKQLAFILKNMSTYLRVRKASWPMNPKDLLRYEASDAMTEMLKIIRKREGKS